MIENVDRKNAEKILQRAFKAQCLKDDEITFKIKKILKGNHKTYKYILVNGLLAKATNNSINALALQAGAPLKGAYDARTLCHKVLVPFERDFLQNALGGSNEPFLNKPARFTHLSDTNPVRKGKDKEALLLLIEIFELVSNSLDAELYLICALDFLNKRIYELNVLNEATINYSPTLVEIYNFIYRFLEKSFEGESLAVIVGSLEKIYHKKFVNKFKVVTHKVNQSGASTNEVGDIDIYKDDIFYYAIEVKDKDFTSYDLEHAFSKIISREGVKGQFIYGINSKFNKVDIEDKIEKFEANGFKVLFNDIISYVKIMIFKIDLNDKQEFIDTIIETAIEINSKEELKIWIQSLLSELKWK